jgi:RNA polymerase sigma-70 factor, ECF subfamily
MNQTTPEVLEALQHPMDPENFTEIVEQFQKPVYNLCARMLGDQTEAEDAAQETFWKAYKNIQSYDPSRSFLTWLLSIAAHYCIDQIRKRRFSSISMDAMPDDFIPDMDPSPESEASQTEEQKRIRGLLEILAPEDKSAVIMRYWYDFSDEEIGSVLHLTVSAVKSRLFRARKQMAQEWLKKENPTMLPARRSHEPSAI